MPIPSDRVPVKEPEEAEYLEEEEVESSGWRNLIGFWILGLCNNYGYVVMLSAAHDILAHHDPHKHDSRNSINIETNTQRECNYMSTGAILLADIIPSLLTKIVAPFFPLCVHVRMFLIIVLSCAGYILVGASETATVAIIGVVCTAFSSGLGEATLLSYMSFFKNKNVISTWSSGTGGAGFFGSLSYATLTGLGLSPSTTLYVLLVVPALMALTFWAILQKPNLEDGGSSTPSVVGGSNFNSNISSDRVPLALSKDSVGEKLRSIPPLFKYMIPLGLVYFFEYLINQGLFELIYFDNIFISHSEQYRWYQVDYQIGVFISRSSINLLKINAIWLLAIFQGLNVIFFTFESLYSFLPNIYIVLAAVLWEGLLGGAAYVNTFHKINNEVVPEKREFSMAITSLADALGITIAGFLSMPIHNYICGLPKNL